jgi:hypothetical protein
MSEVALRRCDLRRKQHAIGKAAAELFPNSHR